MMENNSFFLSLSLFLISLAVRASYELLKKARKINPENKSLVAVIFVVMVVLWLSWFNMCPIDPWRQKVPGGLEWIGLGAVILGLGLALGALVQLRGVENITHLVTNGLFARIRHPMYTGFMLWIFGWSLYHGAFVSLVFGMIGIANILYWRHLEEGRLESAYGDSYRKYRLQTWF
jgi:protein-S-isoprenylcysteine O-methyltransferase Ste14